MKTLLRYLKKILLINMKGIYKNESRKFNYYIKRM